jgi:hypothetical protein
MIIHAEIGLGVLRAHDAFPLIGFGSSLDMGMVYYLSKISAVSLAVLAQEKS